MLKVALCHCQVLLLVMPGESGAACLDAEGQQALSLLRQLGMPSVIGVASSADQDQAVNAAARMKGKAAARKRAAAVLAAEVSRSIQALTQHLPFSSGWTAGC